MNKKIFAIAILVLLSITAFIGIGYAYQASVTTGSNTMSHDYVTLNEGTPAATMFAYKQVYDTYTASDGTVAYRALTGSATDKVKLNTTPYTLVLNDSRNVSNTYTLVASAGFPTLYEDSAQTKWCQFVFVLTASDNVTKYIGKTTAGSSTYTFYLDEGRVTDTVMGEGTTLAALTEGTYSLDVYLKFVTTGSNQNGMEYGVFVDKTRFVDQFAVDPFTMTFVVQAAA